MKNICLFGVSNVGKSTIGELPAKRAGYDFYDLDEEVRKDVQMSQTEFKDSFTLEERDEKRIEVLDSLFRKAGNKVIAVTPITYRMDALTVFAQAGVHGIELTDSPEHIFDRLIFTDENDAAYTDDEYKNRYKDHCLKMIREDLEYYGNGVFCLAEGLYDMNGEAPEEVVNGILREFGDLFAESQRIGQN